MNHLCVWTAKIATSICMQGMLHFWELHMVDVAQWQST